jgi:hypothetical protein
MIDTRTTTAPIETVTPIKPSEAIRLGCLTTTKGEGSFFPKPGQACALGAMAIGLGYDGPRCDHFDCDDTCTGSDPYEVVEGLLGSVSPHEIWEKNDKALWSRERIADWLESLGL